MEVYSSAPPSPLSSSASPSSSVASSDESAPESFALLFAAARLLYFELFASGFDS